MAPVFAYTVTAEFDDEQVAMEWVRWLEHGHLQGVMDGGAREAVLVQRSPLHFEVRYRFDSEVAFKQYEAGPAAALRADSVARFPPSRGVRLSRATGRVLAELPGRP
jgi:hypothetical protein